MAMKQFIELGAVRFGAAIQNVCSNVDFEVLSLPGGSLITVLLWFYATAIGSIRRAATQVHAPRTTIDVPAERPRPPSPRESVDLALLARLVQDRSRPQEATDSYAVFAPDRVRPVEIRATDRSELVKWASQRLSRPVAVPDLSTSGYRFMGGRLIATSHGPAVLFMYDDDHGTRLVLLSRQMAVDKNAPMAQHSHGPIAGFAWADKGIGYSLVGHISSQLLHSLADEARRQLGNDV
jgi:anti-sigma factor RsiW